jgi:hypothetical protein
MPVTVAATIPASFDGLASNLEISALQSTTASTRQQEVRAAMEAGFSVLDSFLTGSYAKSTMIVPLSQADIDIFVVLAPEYYGRYTPSGLLTEVRRVLLGRYPQTPEISPDGQAVTISFTDFKVDVVPAFFRNGGGFIIPNSPNGWINTDPKVHLDQLTRENARQNGLLVPLVKMMKGWNRTQGSPLRGFYLELMTMKVLAGVTITDYPSGVRWVFDKGREAVRYAVMDPAAFGDQVQGLRQGTVEQAVRLFQASYEIAVGAEAWAQTGLYVRTAVDEWRRLFGNYFPAYG